MATKWGWIAAAGLPLLIVGGIPTVGLAAETTPAAPPAKSEQAAPAAPKAPEAAKAPAAAPKAALVKRPAGLVGKVVAVTPKSDTIVVDVPRGKDTLRIGAEVTDHTKIRVDGKKASLEAMKEGERVRISYRRTSTGDVATSLVALPSKG